MGTKKREPRFGPDSPKTSRKLWDGLNPDHLAEYQEPAEVGTYDTPDEQSHIDPDTPKSVFLAVSSVNKRAFLTAYAETGNKAQASKAAGIDVMTQYRASWVNDPVFQAELERARVMSADVLVHEAHRRAVTGTVRFTGWHKGEPGGIVREYSDILLIFLLKGALPERYGDRVQLRTQLQGLDLGKLPDQFIRRIAAGEPLLAVLAGVAEQIPEIMKRLPAKTPKHDTDSTP